MQSASPSAANVLSSISATGSTTMATSITETKVQPVQIQTQNTKANTLLDSADWRRGFTRPSAEPQSSHLPTGGDQSDRAAQVTPDERPPGHLFRLFAFTSRLTLTNTASWPAGLFKGLTSFNYNTPYYFPISPIHVLDVIRTSPSVESIHLDGYCDIPPGFDPPAIALRSLRKCTLVGQGTTSLIRFMTVPASAHVFLSKPGIDDADPLPKFESLSAVQGLRILDGVCSVSFSIASLKADPNVVGSIDYRGNPASPGEAVGLTYSTCTSHCGSGPKSFRWRDFSQLFTSWLLPWLALISQLPFGSEYRLDDLISGSLSFRFTAGLIAYQNAFPTHDQST